MVAPSVLRGDLPGPYTLEEFQGDWVSSLAAFAFGLAALTWFARRYLRGIDARLPYFASSSEPVLPSGDPAAGPPSTPDDRPPY
jgi:hypothetical protein